MTERTTSLNDKVFVELVRSVYVNVMPAIVMCGAFGLCFLMIQLREGDPTVLVLGWITLAGSVLRLGVTLRFRQRALIAALDREQARRLEWAFAVPYLAFSLCLGVFGAYVFILPSPEGHMITICLLVGYCAGVATGTGLRPLIALPSMILAIVPPSIIAIARVDPIYFGMALIALAFLGAGSHTVLSRYASVRTEIGKRLTFTSLARRDALTSLPNRLALREYFDENVTLFSSHSLVAVHYLDLDGFKPVNDMYGHAAGDQLLVAVAERLNGAIRNGDIVARLGGDEFAIIQFGLRQSGEAELLAQRIASAVSQPFSIAHRVIEISTSVGTVVTPDGNIGLDSLLQLADEKLYATKRARKARQKSAA